MAPQTRIKDVLWEFDEASRTKFSEKTTMPVGLWTENVLPVSWNEDWPFEEDEFVERWSNDPKAKNRNRILYNLGNLTLLTGSLNISSGNKWFLKKEAWAESDIRARGEALADMAVSIWPSLEGPE